MAEAGSPQEWFNGLPFVTRHLFAASFGMTVLANVSLLNIRHLLFDWDKIWKGFQIWRMVTPGLFLGKFSIGFLFRTMILVMYSQRYEMAPFTTGTSPSADYLYMLILGFASLNVCSLLLDFLTFNDALVMMITYVWSRRNATTVVSIYGFPVKGMYLPWALVGLTVLTGGSPFEDLVGIAIGHLYYYLVDILPNTHGINVIQTPDFIKQFVESRTTAQSVASTPGPASQPPRPQGHNWGTGRTLGGR